MNFILYIISIFNKFVIRFQRIKENLNSSLQQTTRSSIDGDGT